MLIQFTIGNFLSFKDPVTFSMVAASIREHDENIFNADKKIKLLKSAVVYGANASGKSNLIKALSFMKQFIFTSAKESQATEPIDITNFKLSTETENKPSFFEIIFIEDGIRYRYGFELDKTEVHKEWLYCVPTRQEVKLFVREKNNIEIGSYFKKEGKGLIDKTRPNALFLSVVAQFNGEISTKILKWFYEKVQIISGLKDTRYKRFTIKKLKDLDFKTDILKFLKIADLGIDDINHEEKTLKEKDLPKDMPEEIKNFMLKHREFTGVNASHKKCDTNGNVVSNELFDLKKFESAGTQKFFALSAPLLDTLKNRRILIVDELDSQLHPILTKHIIKLFNSAEFNPMNAQLIFASHDTNLLNKELFRRDQIWFTEKNKFGATDLYSLVEYKTEKGTIRKDASYEKDYILGKYGAIPYIGDFTTLFKRPK